MDIKEFLKKISKNLKLFSTSIIGIGLLIIYVGIENIGVNFVDINIFLVFLYFINLMMAIRADKNTLKLYELLGAFIVFFIAVIHNINSTSRMNSKIYLSDSYLNAIYGIWFTLVLPSLVYLIIVVIRIVQWTQSDWEEMQERRRAYQKLCKEKKQIRKENKYRIKWNVKEDKNRKKESYRKEKYASNLDYNREIKKIEKRYILSFLQGKDINGEIGKPIKFLITLIFTVVFIIIYFITPLFWSKNIFQEWITSIQNSFANRSDIIYEEKKANSLGEIISEVEISTENVKDGIVNRNNIHSDDSINVGVDNELIDEGSPQYSNLQETHTESIKTWLKYSITFIACMTAICLMGILIFKAIYGLVDHIIGENKNSSEFFGFFDEYSTPLSILIVVSSTLDVFYVLTSFKELPGLFEKLVCIILYMLLILVAIDAVRLVLHQCTQKASLLKSSMHLIFILLIDCMVGIVLDVFKNLNLRGLISDLLAFFINRPQSIIYQEIEKTLEKAKIYEIYRVRKALREVNVCNKKISAFEKDVQKILFNKT